MIAGRPAWHASSTLANMSEPRVTFQNVTERYTDTFRFFDDRIERDWKVIVRKGRVTYPVKGIDARIAEQTAFAHGFGTALRYLAAYAIAGIVLEVGFAHPVLKVIGLGLFVVALITGVLAVYRLRTDTWLYVRYTNGGTLFSVRVKGLKGITREQFVSEIRRYSDLANHLPEATPGQRPPTAPSPSAGAPQL